MNDRIFGTSKVYGILGCPVAHSVSPVMQNAAFMAAGIDAVYVPFHVEPGDIGKAVNGLRSLGVAGFNLTIPHKTSVMDFLDWISPEARVAGAVNTVVNSGGVLKGHNTDGAGLLISISRDLGMDVCGKRVLLLGGGGAARGALAELLGRDVGPVSIVNRNTETGRKLVDDMLSSFPEANINLHGYDAIEGILPDTDLLINATSVGLGGEKICGLPLELIPKIAKVYDMVYGPVQTPLVRRAIELGIKAVDGSGMLVAQGELAFMLWTGSMPPEGVMKMAVEQRVNLART